MTCCMQQCFRLLVKPHMIIKKTSCMARVNTQQSGNSNLSYTSTKIGMVTGGSGCMEIFAVSSLHDILHAAVLQIISKATRGKSKHL